MREGNQGHYLMLQGYMNLSKSIYDFSSSSKGILSLETRLSLEREGHRELMSRTCMWCIQAMSGAGK